MNAIVYNNYWISTDTYLTQAHRDINAQLVADYLYNLGWTREAIAGILGNMDVESSVNPALIEGTGYQQLITNQQCLLVPSNRGVGLVQWTGDTTTPPVGQKLASFAIRYNKEWYDGELQCFRLEREYQTNIQFDPGTVEGQYWDWQIYVSSTASPELLAKVFQYQYERGGTDTQLRQQKARYYYDLIRQTIKPWLYFKMSSKRKELKRRCLRI